MSELPTSWLTVGFDEAVEIISDRGFRIQQKAYLPAGDLAVVDQGEGLIGGYTNDLNAKVDSHAPLIVFGDHTRRFKFVRFPFAVGADGVKLFSPTALWDPIFLYLQLGTINLENRGYGRHYQHLRKELLALPPAYEQTRIVEKLEELFSDLDAGVAELKAAQKKLAQYRQSLLKAAVEGALTSEWRAARKVGAGDTAPETGAELLARILRERRARWEAKQLAKFAEQGKPPPKDWQKKYPEPKKPDSRDLPKLPEGWVWASVEQLGVVQLGRQRSPDKMHGICPARYIRAANITEQGIDFSDVLEMDFNDKERETFALKTGDLLLTEASGSPEHVGRPVIWPEVEGLFCFQNTVLRFTPQGISSEFAYRLFQAWQKLGVFSTLSGGVGINHLSAGKFSTLAVPLPSTAEQKACVNALEFSFATLTEQDQCVQQSLKQSAAQRKNILKAAFSGQLVPQDANDEPASVLLERIRAERAARDALKKPRGRKTKEKD